MKLQPGVTLHFVSLTPGYDRIGFQPKLSGENQESEPSLFGVRLRDSPVAPSDLSS